MENFELYIIGLLIIGIIWMSMDTVKYYRGEKRKVKLLHRFAKEGEVESQGNLAKHYHKGYMVKKDCQKAAFWYQKAAFGGDERSTQHLKRFFLNSKRDIKKIKC